MIRILCLLAIAFPCLVSARTQDAANTPPADREALVLRIEEAVKRHVPRGFWGAVLVAKDGKILFAKGYGEANDDHTPITADTLFDIASISKHVTACAVLTLEMDGKLSIDDPVSTFFPVGVRAEEVTLRHLLTHTSGMSDSRAIQHLAFADRDEAVRRALTSRPDAEPGEKYAYCNAGYIVLAAVVEKASGEKFEDYVRERLFKPAGLTGTGFLDGVGLDAAKCTVRETKMLGRGVRRVTLFASADGEPWAWGLRGAGGVLTTMNDLVRWDRALRGDAILNDAAKEKMYRVEKGGYALGWMVETTARGTRRVHHGGGTRGFRSSFSRHLEDDVVIAVLTNENGQPQMIERAITETLFPDERPSIEGKIYTRGLALNEHDFAEIKDGVRIAISRRAGEGEHAGEQVVLTLSSADAVAARLTLAPAQAQRLAERLKVLAEGAQPGEGEARLMLATKPYARDEQGVATLPAGARYEGMPHYPGVDPKTSRPLADERPTLVVIDEASGYWPVILVMDHALAARVAGELGAVEERER